MKRVSMAALAALASFAAAADEGMWTFDNPPRAAIAEKYGVTLDDAWLNRVRGATVRLESGCTGSFISGDGLVLTNHHCAEECIAQNSTPDNDLIANGFLAGTRDKEVRCQEEAISVLVGTEEASKSSADVRSACSLANVRTFSPPAVQSSATAGRSPYSGKLVSALRAASPVAGDGARRASSTSGSAAAVRTRSPSPCAA